MILKCRMKGKFYFFKKQRKDRLYNRIRAITGLVKPSIWGKDRSQEYGAQKKRQRER